MRQLQSNAGGLEMQSSEQQKVGGCGMGWLEERGRSVVGGAPPEPRRWSSPRALRCSRNASTGCLQGGFGWCAVGLPGEAGAELVPSPPGRLRLPRSWAHSSAPGVTEISSNAEWGCNKFFKLAAAAA